MAKSGMGTHYVCFAWAFRLSAATPFLFAPYTHLIASSVTHTLLLSMAP